jgi:hypothetical protein
MPSAMPPTFATHSPKPPKHARDVLPVPVLAAILGLGLAAAIPGPGLSQTPQGAAEARPCSPTLIATVEQRLPLPPDGPQVRDLSCTGVTQLYFLLTSDEDWPPQGIRQRVLAVFRAEGLIR